jgi:hypothetical protein
MKRPAKQVATVSASKGTMQTLPNG